ncbi:Inactive leucine-rich repeat receptor-like serine/threonine-protein kinase [Capsicum annuum]|uniref:Inactive leucine-rich repeat receptor-like serine/threonine-protein kinase n=1 Tax=Capsicum annuum TaxID=4072 RepID=A0A1U8GMG7_CAPAN|nr:inactive leucine-rich repeat receptor-like serine/threonine-protein kinase At1g60630 [Capsicum annuum]KAF3622211.1 Inactive leucine-rich repeat receptor-like serine/threonine-protein kinase [Capsicum annuum]KAF3623327.1 Inactive leucine-rich repeat receptor-like serine/threonine-protein kinase [Capsicum annuum]PHT81221.1 Inactive leucine-rich repeat receptor-like serine/threonine-protein kinase [Capsicum annuum]
MEIKNPFLFFIFTIFSIVSPLVKSGDTEALLALKATIDPSDILDWKKETDLCQWQGVKECMKGRVTKLVIENLNLSGTLDQNALNQLDQLRVLSFKGNSISGEIPDLNGLFNLKSLFLNSNNFSGEFPVTVTSLHRIKVLVLAGNKLSGDIPLSLTNLSRLYVLYLEDNQFTGEIPPLNQPSLRFLNVSNNQFSGQITETPVISRFNESSFAGNVNLCGAQLHNNCTSTSPSYPIIPENVSHHHKRSKKLIIIIVPVVVGILILCILAGILIACVRKRRRKTRDGKSKEVEDGGGGGAGGGEEGTSRGGNGDGGRDGNNGGKEGAFSWDQGSGGLGTLVFCGPGDQQMNYSLEDLLKASAETLGRGIIGSTYKAVMESGYIVTVKRLRDSRFPRLEEFRRHVEIIGRLRHPNLVPLRAYFQAKEERLLVYDYFPNGSLFSLVHGTRANSGSKPLHWTSCLKIAEDVATGLLHIHQNPGLTHGNLKSSNVLLGSDFESCLTDYGLMPFRNPDSPEESGASSLFYRAPECRDIRRPVTHQADVYSFGVLLLELLTGKTPFQDLVQEHGSDIPRWVRSVREEETESGDEPASSNEASEEKLGALLNVAMACVSLVPENRPTMKDVLRMIRDARAEAQGSSNSSDHSPGRWSDTIQSLPRDDHLSI